MAAQKLCGAAGRSNGFMSVAYHRPGPGQSEPNSLSGATHIGGVLTVMLNQLDKTLP